MLGLVRQYIENFLLFAHVYVCALICLLFPFSPPFRIHFLIDPCVHAAGRIVFSSSTRGLIFIVPPRAFPIHHLQNPTFYFITFVFYAIKGENVLFLLSSSGPPTRLCLLGSLFSSCKRLYSPFSGVIPAFVVILILLGMLLGARIYLVRFD